MALVFDKISLKSAPGSDVLFQQQQQQVKHVTSTETTQSKLLFKFSTNNMTTTMANIVTKSSESSVVSSSTSSPSERTFDTCNSGIIFAGSYSITQPIGTLTSSTVTAVSTASALQSSNSDNLHQVKEASFSYQPNQSSSSLDCELNCASVRSSAEKSIPSVSISDIVCSNETSNGGISSLTAGSNATSTTASQMLLNSIVNNGGCAADTNLVNQQRIITEDPRTLQLALELSMVGFNDALAPENTSAIANDCNSIASVQHYQTLHHQQQQRQQQRHTNKQLSPISLQQSQQQAQHQHSLNSFNLNSLNALTAAVAAAAANNSHNNNDNISNITNVNLHNQFTTSLPSSPAATQSVNSLLPSFVEDRLKKSQNMTECVPVPSSEHVAEIVGRQGCKIKALRAKTNTYIKTPVRGEEPVFVVTGRKEDVSKAKREILSAAEHFSLIRATRKPTYDISINANIGNVSNTGSSTFGGRTPSGPPTLPGQVTIQVRVPYRVVGLVVGPKGATIKHIQQETQTYIVTPSREKDPIFEVTGLPDNVQSARKKIESHIAMRTGNLPMVSPAIDGSVGTVHTINTLSQILNEDINAEFLASLYKNGICSAFDCIDSNSVNGGVGIGGVGLNTNVDMSNLNIINAVVDTGINDNNQLRFASNPNSNNFVTHTTENVSNNGYNIDVDDIHHQAAISHTQANAFTAVNSSTIFNNNCGHSTTVLTTNGLTRSCSSASSTTSSRSAHNSGGSTSSRPELINIWKSLGDSLDVDEGIGESPSIWTLPTTRTVLNGNSINCSPSTSISPTDSLLGEISAAGTHQMITTQCESVINVDNGSNNIIVLREQQLADSHSNINMYGTRRECLVCSEKEVTAALVPCGHNMFCMDCASRICLSGSNAFCPVCNQTVYHAMRILA